jgi:hypothetical protein
MAKSRTSKAAVLRQIPAARAREARERATGRRAVSAYYDRQSGRVMMELTSGFVFGFPAKSVPALAKASPQQLAAARSAREGVGCTGRIWTPISACRGSSCRRSADRSG